MALESTRELTSDGDPNFSISVTCNVIKWLKEKHQKRSCSLSRPRISIIIFKQIVWSRLVLFADHFDSGAKHIKSFTLSMELMMHYGVIIWLFSKNINQLFMLTLFLWSIMRHSYNVIFVGIYSLIKYFIIFRF